eukprot:CAMPEP_0184672546 /NCGR_PEP_ID=MMETSP0308-20130426/86160_1 /TAXON_ID=38269 /ORGANISM="Gloeochaete witrockiana, Strain SAG 46.84" /LENGTH=311 /DNA_ID=CAMNT_0027119885 /DNA_START=67 /DNA_END=1002 /DNA_ORIENTATION=+
MASQDRLEQSESILRKICSSRKVIEHWSTLEHLVGQFDSSEADAIAKDAVRKISQEPIAAWRLLCHISRVEKHNAKHAFKIFMEQASSICAETVAEHFHVIMEREEILDSDLYFLSPDIFLKIVNSPSLQMNRYHSLAVYRALDAYTAARSPTMEDACHLWPNSKAPPVPQDLSEDALHCIAQAIDRFCPRHAIKNCQCGRARAESGVSQTDDVQMPTSARPPLSRRPTFRRSSSERTSSTPASSTPVSPRSPMSTSISPSSTVPPSLSQSPVRPSGFPQNDVPILDQLPSHVRKLSGDMYDFDFVVGDLD